MDVEKFLLSLLIVLVASRVAAEAAERVKQPAVLGEILAGILIGPSLLGLVDSSEPLALIGELGAILLLFEVGMHMNLGQLGRVGGDSLRVAAIGIALPMILSLLVLDALGVPSSISLFVAGAVTATSVGITARVFGDLRALASSEARTVLGAAVADDVGGLLILTVVTAVASGSGVTTGALVTIIAGALGFVLFATLGAAWAAPALFRQISARVRTDGSLMALALAFALALAVAAARVHLAPIIGAFIAGLALSRTEARDEIQRRLVPLAHFFVPIFFLLIGIETDLSVFADPGLLGVASVLTLVSIAGKVASGLGVRRGRANRLLVGVAMAPRGEVGLIFAGIGLTAGILDSRFYGVLVAVVLVTTLITPPWVRRLIQKARRRAVAVSTAITEPSGGWLVVTADDVELGAEPPDLLAGRIGLEAALACASRQPGPWLLQWLSSAEQSQTHWDDPLRRRFFALLKDGNVRSWRFLEVTGLLDSWLPVLGEAAGKRKRDPLNLEPGGDLRWDLLEDLHALIRSRDHAHSERSREGMRFSGVWDRIENKDLVYLAALARSAFGGSPDAPSRTSVLAQTIGLSEADTSVAVFLIEEQSLLPAAAKRLDMGTENSVLELASHVGTPQKADALYVLAAAENAMEPWEHESLDELFELVQGALAHRQEPGPSDPVKRRMLSTARALSHLSSDLVMGHLQAAPRRYLVAHGPQAVSRHIDMTATPLARYEVRLEAEPGEGRGEWTVHVAVQDRKGLLAAISGVFASREISVEEAFVSTWHNGNALDVFRVLAPLDTDWEEIRHSLAAVLPHAGGNGAEAEAIEGVVEIDNLASPWHTILEIRAYDRKGLLHKVASALSRAGLQIQMAVVTTDGDVAVDIFYVCSANGGKLDEAGERRLRSALEGKSQRHWPRVRRERSGAAV